MDTNLSVVCGNAKHVIYIHNPCNALESPVPCTKACIEAVRDYMVNDMSPNSSSVGYRWKRKDGKIVKLVCLVEESE